MLEILVWILLAYLICGVVNAFFSAARDYLENERNMSAPYITARALLVVALGFLPALPHIWQFISRLPSALRLEARAMRRRE